ncbi:LPS assembly lipoprotein LptE [Bradyrhizobium sp. G127]|jgi:LPS-assembly lipoprotein|uniref:LPS assembly lipoprotein LptE n=1 Tax=Bradyrhizobium sp. G127 TaxID=2904800 RepID=UPI001F357C83|nr:LPS assembly lipoprotein LptE [Bradyrhizobium sp. G127]MCF2521302.1 LPS assembly lipoprotein LptE [Bradyrhizobium sp. G127]
MSWFDTRVAARLLAVVAIAALTAGCFQPMYAERSLDGGSALRDKLQGVEVPPLNLPNGSREARLGVEIRNALMFSMYGSAVGGPPTHRLLMRITTTRLSVIVDPTTARPDIENYGIDAVYELKDNATDKTVLTGTTFSRVSYDIPGQAQRFARSRGLRDAEDRAAKVIADNISQRLASFFIAGT